VEWYFGYHSLPLGGDMRCEDFRTRADIWQYTRVARQFVEPLPLPDMIPDDSLLSASDGQLLYQVGVIYALYLPNGGNHTLDLSAEYGDWKVLWYNVETGEWAQPVSVPASAAADLGTPAFSGDVAAIVEKEGAG
jgi:hypothetical protein